MLVLFDDILIYSKSRATHLEHVDKSLQLLHGHQLFVNFSKCSFGVSEIEYLGHIVGKYGLRVDPKSIAAMQEWSHPKTLKSLHGFLGNTKYYRKCVRKYSKIVAPLTSLTMKNAFSRNEVVEKSFSILRQAMCNTHVLGIPYFSKNIVLECDALGKVLGVVIMQEGHPLAFTSK